MGDAAEIKYCIKSTCQSIYIYIVGLSNLVFNTFLGVSMVAIQSMVFISYTKILK